MGARADEATARSERARAIGLFRYGFIREAADPGVSTPARGRLGRAGAAAEHTDPTGRRVRVSRDTLDRWIRAWRRGGFDALVPSPRQSAPRLPVEVVEMAVALKRENPDRTGAQARRILAAQMGWAPGERTLQRWFADDPQIADQLAAGAAGPVFGRFEAGRPNELWTGDALHGPTVAGRKTYLFAFLDDHSRAIMGHRFGFAEDTVRLAAALRPALGSRGVPDGIYVDNGSAFVDAWLLRACAKLGIRLIHSTPGRPQGRGKIERYFRTVREQFLVEITGEPHHRRRRRPGPAPGRRPGRAQRAVHRLGRDRLPPPDPLRDRPGPARPLERRWPVSDPEHRRAGRGVPLGGTPHRHQDRAGVAAGQHLPGRPAAGRAPRRAGVRPVRPHPHPGPAPRHPGRHRDPAPHRPPRPPQSPARNPTRAAGTDRDRLRPPDRPHPPSPARPPRRRQLRRTGRQPPRRQQRSAPRPARPTHRRPDHRRRGAVVIDRLQGFFGFTRTPFGRDLAPGMLHRHTSHGEAVARIGWCITEHRIGVITGEVGAGKTVAVRAALAALDPTRHTIIYLPNPTVGVRGIHHQIVAALGARPLTHHATLVPQTVDALAVEQVERGRTPVVVIDEAHLLDHAQLESIRMLTNHDMDSTSPFASLLVGQPTLRRRMKLGVLAALDQRIGLRYAMPPMTPQETGSYLRHHVGLAGRSDTLFSDDATALIHQTSRGYPRAVNNLAVQALVAAFASNKAIVDESSTRAAVAEVTAE